MIGRVRLAWGMFALTAVFLIAMIGLSAGREEAFDTILYGLLTASAATAGALIATRQPRNPIGWILLFLGAWGAFAEVAEGWGFVAADHDLPGGAVGEWIIAWSWIVDLTGWAMLLLIFPDGRIPAGRWRLVPWGAGVGLCLAFVDQALSTATDSEFTSGHNPFAVVGGALEPAFIAGSLVMVVAFATSFASLIARFRRAGGLVRQQIKWIAFSAGGVALFFPIAVAFWYQSVLVQAVTALLLTALPVSFCVAILRYRLYDIDVVINRALVYGALTASLAAVYLGSVLLLQLTLSGVTKDSGLAVAASTLAVAALFRPARARIQATVDRRFFRRRYNAARTLDGFGARVRDEVALDSLSTHLRAVVADTMQPAHVSLWLKVKP